LEPLYEGFIKSVVNGCTCDPEDLDSVAGLIHSSLVFLIELTSTAYPSQGTQYIGYTEDFYHAGTM
jgi:hypothetical protein